MAASTSSAPPLSPWANRFSSGVEIRKEPDFIWDNALHSGLAPEIPRFDDPIHYADMTGKLPTRAPPSDEEIDRLFRTETYQEQLNQGIKTWEAAILNRWVRFSPRLGHISAGHMLGDAGDYAKTLQDIFDVEKIKVDESRWEMWLKKHHWLDWVEESPPGRDREKTWSVDDEKIWSILRITIELVDRVIKTLVEEKHDALQTLLFGRIEPWENVVPDSIPDPYGDSEVLLSHSKEQYLAQLNGTPCQYDSMTTHSTSEWKETLRTLLYTHLLSFGRLKGVDATCYSLPGTKAIGITLIGVTKLEILCSDTQLTIGERCMMHVLLAVTILHELAHAITRARRMRPAPGVEVKCPPQGFREPFVDYEQGSNEMGEWFEQRVFGGIGHTQDMPLGYSMTEMPSAMRPSRFFVPGPWLDPDAITRMHYVPVSWHSRLMAEDFWKSSDQPRKSRNFFHRPTVFVNETLTRLIRLTRWDVTHALQPDPYLDTYEDDLRIVQHWQNRHNIWKDFRAAWYDDEYFQWRRSPWSHLSLRWLTDAFAEAFADGDEVGCAVIADRLADSVGWRTDRETFVRSMAYPGWIFHCIGLLMMAAIPTREATIRRVQIQAHIVRLTPSQLMSEHGLKKVFSLRRRTLEHDRGDEAEKSVLFDHINDRGQIADGFSQLDYLAVAADVVSWGTPRGRRDVFVHFSWVNSIKVAIQTLSQDRQALRARLPNGHVFMWAPNWAFDAPKYDKDVGYYNADGSAHAMKFRAVPRGWE
ncbi:hypothetical protein F4859DRAFT_491922 [Xylaria cf. heliscus]|nr:hypothetical protein F4859DRAFT_491922 [Xylaria cf. heliscus]